MPIATGSRLGPYEIVSPLGAGGMGEVYRARDPRLQREVAIKVLLPQFLDNADLKQRFEREARSISSLQHSNICTLFDIGENESGTFLVMEYLEGETLAARLQRGPMPLAEIVKVATQVAEALDKAHRSGIIHRDLKPGNIMLTKSGAKLMDFGLAKPLARVAGASNTSAPLLSAAMTTSSPSPQISPLTTAGTIVGTIQYMSPEQIEGREADARSDIFAFGAVLYEMATGKRAFQGKSQLTVASAILEQDPQPASAITPMIPPAFDRVVKTCLAKDPEERFQAARDVSLELRWVGEAPAAFAGKDKFRIPKALVAAIVLSVAALGVLIGYGLSTLKKDTSQVRAALLLPDDIKLESLGDNAGMPVISPDGRNIVFSAHSAKAARSLWVRPLDQTDTHHLDGTEGASHPFWSPDGKTIGFFRDGKLARIPADGGPVTVVTAAPNSRGGTWLNDDTILFTPDFQASIHKVTATGGTSTAVTKLDLSKHSTHRWPFALPDGKHFLYLATTHNIVASTAMNGIYFASVDGKEDKFIVESDSGAQYANGYLLFHQGNTLQAQPFDPSTGNLSGTPMALLQSIRNDMGVWRAIYSVSQTGRMIYENGTGETLGSKLLWVDRNGKQLGSIGDSGRFMDPRISPDGRRIAVSYGDPQRDIWIFDAVTGTKMRLTFNQGVGGTRVQPSWSKDGKEILFFASFGGGDSGEAHLKAVNGSGPERVAIKLKPGAPIQPSFSPDGKYYVYLHTGAGHGSDALAIQPVNGGEPKIIIEPSVPQSTIQMYRISPDGKWVAYTSDESGNIEVYVAAFPSGEGKWQISNGGGVYPLWGPDGKELYFAQPSGPLMSAKIEEKDGEIRVLSTETIFNSLTPQLIALGSPIDVSPDGKKFLINTSTEPNTPTTMQLYTNWMAAVKK